LYNRGFMAKSTSEYYKKNPEARRKRLKQQARYNRKSMQIKKRVELNRENRKRGTYGNGDGKDVSHKKDGSTVLEKASKNRARNRSRK
jgi:hypothetical protein